MGEGEERKGAWEGEEEKEKEKKKGKEQGKENKGKWGRADLEQGKELEFFPYRKRGRNPAIQTYSLFLIKFDLTCPQGRAS